MNLNVYGPAYFMLADASSKMIQLLDPSLSAITAWHFVYFFTFLTSILMLYLLSRRWMSKWAAFGAALLFASQPLIWGHSFMNPKDLPFMVFFLASIYFGLQMLDASPKSKWKWLIPAGIILGLTISIRVIGPLAGLLDSGLCRHQISTKNINHHSLLFSDRRHHHILDLALFVEKSDHQLLQQH